MLKALESLPKKNHRTCSVINPVNNAVTFVRSLEYIGYLRATKKNLIVLAPSIIPDVPEKVKIIPTPYPEYEFTLFQNWIATQNIDLHISVVTWPSTSFIHPTALIGLDGLKYVLAPDGSKVRFTHTGKVIIEDDVDIGAYTIIHRGTMDNTYIREGVKIGDKVNIGHNNDIGSGSVIAPGTVTSGSVKIGKDCWLGVGSVVRHFVNICDKVVLGAGTVVVKDIEKSGVYVGNPAQYLKEYPERFNF